MFNKINKKIFKEYEIKWEPHSILIPLYFSRLFIFFPCTNNKPQAINGLPGQHLGMGIQVLQAAVEHIELGQEQQAEGDKQGSPEAKGHAHEDLAEQLGGIHRRICDGGQGVEGIPALQGQHTDAQHQGRDAPGDHAQQAGHYPHGREVPGLPEGRMAAHKGHPGQRMVAILAVDVLHVGQEASGAEAPVDGPIPGEKVYYGHGEGIGNGLQFARWQDIQCGFRKQDSQMQRGKNHHGAVDLGQKFAHHLHPLWPAFGHPRRWFHTHRQLQSHQQAEKIRFPRWIQTNIVPDVRIEVAVELKTGH